MSTSFLSTFVPDRFSNLRSLLSGLFSASEVSQDHLKEVYSELDKARPWFLNLLNVPQPSKEERETVEKGECILPILLRELGSWGEGWRASRR